MRFLGGILGVFIVCFPSSANMQEGFHSRSARVPRVIPPGVTDSTIREFVGINLEVTAAQFRTHCAAQHGSLSHEDTLNHVTRDRCELAGHDFFQARFCESRAWRVEKVQTIPLRLGSALSSATESASHLFGRSPLVELSGLPVWGDDDIRCSIEAVPLSSTQTALTRRCENSATYSPCRAHSSEGEP